MTKFHVYTMEVPKGSLMGSRTETQQYSSLVGEISDKNGRFPEMTEQGAADNLQAQVSCLLSNAPNFSLTLFTNLLTAVDCLCCYKIPHQPQRGAAHSLDACEDSGVYSPTIYTDLIYSNGFPRSGLTVPISQSSPL